jgi:hypothetical protein
VSENQSIEHFGNKLFLRLRKGLIGKIGLILRNNSLLIKLTRHTNIDTKRKIKLDLVERHS